MIGRVSSSLISLSVFDIVFVEVVGQAIPFHMAGCQDEPRIVDMAKKTHLALAIGYRLD